MKAAGQWRYVDRAIDHFGRVIDIVVSSRRDAGAARRFVQRAIGTTKVAPAEVATDQARLYPAVLDELLPAAWHRSDRYTNNRVEGDHGRRGHYELAVDAPVNQRVAVAFDEPAAAI